MQFAFTEDQLAINLAAREMLVDSCTPADLRRLLASGEARDEARGTAITGMGLLGMLAPESADGETLRRWNISHATDEPPRRSTPGPPAVRWGHAHQMIPNRGKTGGNQHCPGGAG